MLLIDSSIIISFFRKNEILHKDAVEIIKNSKKLLIIDYVLSEILTVLKMREWFDIANLCLDFLENNNDIEILNISQENFLDAKEIFKKYNNNLSFVDILLFVVKKDKNLKLATFDKDLVKFLEKNF